MAKRKQLFHPDDVRQKIQVSQLINLLHKNAFGELPEELSQGRLKSIDMLLKKAIGDVSAITISGDAEAPVKMVIEWQRPEGRVDD